jgi:hypothetical protein
VTFSYNARPHDTKLLFVASTDPSNRDLFFVKFTRRYSDVVYHYVASHGGAPRLQQCSRVPDGWIAVIMDKSDYEPLYVMTLSSDENQKVRSRLEEVVSELHAGGLFIGTFGILILSILNRLHKEPMT